MPNMKRRSAINHDEEEELVSTLREHIRMDREIEDAKIRLAGRPDFNLSDAFTILDRNAKGWVSGPEILEALHEMGVHIHKEDVYLWVRRYDKDCDGRV
jgi:Ca2+-binding EF-hand superfamily protein